LDEGNAEEDPGLWVFETLDHLVELEPIALIAGVIAQYLVHRMSRCMTSRQSRRGITYSEDGNFALSLAQKFHLPWGIWEEKEENY
jgi:hypothetical protein